MNRLIISILLILCMGCITKKEEHQPTQGAMAKMEAHGPFKKEKHSPFESHEKASFYSTFKAEDYELKFGFDSIDTNHFNLILDMTLKNGAYYVSPLSKGNFTGIFKIIIEDNDKLSIINKPIETPPSVEIFDPHPFVNGYVNWVKEDTMYTQKIERLTDNNFTVTGIIQFTIEPRCTLEKIPFFIKYQDGKLKIEIDRC